MLESAPPLIKYDAARRALDAARRVDEAKEIRDKALALAAYARQAKDRDLMRWAAEIKIRAERRCGQLLREMASTGQRHNGKNPQTLRHSRASERSTPVETLTEIGVSRQQSSDWQQLANVSEPEFERRLTQAKRDPQTMTTTRILHGAQSPSSEPDPFQQEHELWAPVLTWLDDAGRMPPLQELRRVKPTGGVRNVLKKRLLVVAGYVRGLERLRKEGHL